MYFSWVLLHLLYMVVDTQCTIHKVSYAMHVL